MANTRREDRLRLAAHVVVHLHKYGTRAAARILGVPKSTVHDWIRQGPEGIRNPRLRAIAQGAVARSWRPGTVSIMREALPARHAHLAEPTGRDVEVAGICVLAPETGRVLMIQRSNADESDPAAGTWEFPGGHLEEAESPWDGAKREWEEELGCELPGGGEIEGGWQSPDGRYRGFVYRVSDEDEVDCNLEHGNRTVLNPDDPDGDDIEVCAWWDPEQLPMPGMRAEVAEQWPAILATIEGHGDASLEMAEQPPQQQTGVMVALFPEPAVAEALALDPSTVQGEALPADELHLTLCFMGQASQLEDPDRLIAAVQAYAREASPVRGVISGVGRFSGGDQALYVSLDTPQFPAWRQDLVERLNAAGLRESQLHGYTPHMTLALKSAPADLLAVPEPNMAVTLDTITVAIAGVRSTYNLLGGGVYAESGRKPSGDTLDPERDPNVDAPRTPPEYPKETPPEQGEDESAAQRQAADEHIYEPGDIVTDPEGTHLGVQEPEPPIMDALALAAWKRYYSLITNDVPHYAAVHAVKQIDPDFTITDSQARRAFRAVGKGDEPISFAESNWSRSRIEPPNYVQTTYDRFRMTPEQVQALQDEVYKLAVDSYLEGINQSLISLGFPIETSITDPETLSSIQGAVQETVQGVVNTYERDLGGETYTAWIEMVNERGRQSSAYWLQQALQTWVDGRAEWKAEQIAETECFPGGTLVRAAGVVGATARHFDGVVTKIVTASGHELTGTSNHPVLTRSGWHPLGALREGDHVFRDCGIKSMQGTGEPDVYNCPTPIEEVFRALKEIGTVKRVRTSRLDFHGDGIRNGYVDVVMADRELLTDGEPTLGEPSGQRVLEGSDVGEGRFAGLRYDQVPVLVGNEGGADLVAPPGRPNPLASTLVGAGQEAFLDLGRGVSPAERSGFGSGAQDDSSQAQAPLNRMGADAIEKGDLLARELVFEVEPDEIVRVEEQNFSGTVFNLVTQRGNYSADSIIAHNCSRWWNQGGLDFYQRNRGALDPGGEALCYVSPDECQCEACLELVGDNPYAPDEAMALGIPLHPRCIHTIDTSYPAAARSASTSQLWTGRALDDGEEAEAG